MCSPASQFVVDFSSSHVFHHPTHPSTAKSAALAKARFFCDRWRSCLNEIEILCNNSVAVTHTLERSADLPVLHCLKDDFFHVVRFAIQQF